MDNAGFTDRASASLRMAGVQRDGLRSFGTFTVECWSKPDRKGRRKLKWREVFPNKTPDVGIQYILDAALSAGSAISSWYVGLTNASPVGAAGDTMGGAHAGWTENSSYSEGTRQAWTKTRTGNTDSNSASKAIFTINAGGQTIGGAFIVSDSTKGGTAGTLLAVGAFTQGNRSPASGDQIVVQYDFAGSSTN
jgi:hypothetical protein